LFAQAALQQNLKGPFGRAALHLLSDFAEAVLLSPPHNPDLNRLNADQPYSRPEFIK
jgi:hypothetical protein